MTEALLFEIDGRVARLTLNRPERRNALDGDLVGALLTRLAAIDEDPEIRVLVLSGSGEAFCSGADIDWMRARLMDTTEANRVHAGTLADLMQRLNGLSKPTIVRIEGPAYGGGVGLIACCDIAIAADSAVFALSEARLGLAPAVIAPYVIAAMGQRQARRLFLTAARIDAHEARRLGLVHRVVPVASLDEAVEAEVGCLLAGGPEALTHCKRISLGNLPQDPERTGSAELLTRLWASPPSSKSAGPGGKKSSGGTNRAKADEVRELAARQALADWGAVIQTGCPKVVFARDDSFTNSEHVPALLRHPRTRPRPRPGGAQPLLPSAARGGGAGLGVGRHAQQRLQSAMSEAERI
jgi:methylglutaconyl-CoA hydratase